MMVDETTSTQKSSDINVISREPLELPRTKWPTIAGVFLIISMVLLMVTGFLFYDQVSIIEGMDGDGPIEGIIYERLHQQDIPVSDVNVSIVGTDLWVLTDNSGKYTLDNVPAGTQKIRFEKPGYKTIILEDIIYEIKHLEDAGRDSNNFSFPNNLRAGLYVGPFDRQIDHQKLTLANGTVSGVVQNETGLSIADVNVSYIKSEDVGFLPFEAYRTKQTDPAGNFAINVTQGRYILNVTYPGYKTVHREVLVEPLSNGSSVIQLEAGTGLIEELLSETYSIHGKVETKEGDPIKSVRVEIEGTDVYTMTDVAGGYTLDDVPVGLRTVTVSREAYSVISEEVFVNASQSKNYTLDYLGEETVDNSDVSLFYYCAVIYFGVGSLLLAGGIFALFRKSYSLALLAGVAGIGVAAPLARAIIPCIAIILCLVAVIGVYISRREFG